MSFFWSLVKRDFLLAIRHGGGAALCLGFFLVIITLQPLGIGPDPDTLKTIAPGVMWIALLLSVLLSADRIFQADYEDGSLDVIMNAPLPIEMAVLAKALAHWLSTCLPLVLISPVLGLFFNLEPSSFAALIITALVGSPALSLMSTVGAAMTVSLRRGGLLLSVLILPLLVPVLIFGVFALQNFAENAISAPMLFLMAISLSSLVICPIAASGALRANIE